MISHAARRMVWLKGELDLALEDEERREYLNRACERLREEAKAEAAKRAAAAPKKRKKYKDRRCERDRKAISRRCPDCGAHRPANRDLICVVCQEKRRTAA